MKNLIPSGAWPKLQRHWDIRAACNFIGGGTGCGLIIGAAAAAVMGQSFAPALLTGLICVALGLTAVLLEIGRPWRAINIFFHPQTSWMTREGVAAPPLFATGGVALLLHWFSRTNQTALALAVLSGLMACGFLYCQARILRAAKGIPAWREATLMPFILVGGLTDGAGILAVLAAFGLAPSWAIAAALLFCVLRLVAWRRYRAGLRAHGAPLASMAALDRIDAIFVGIGHGVVALLLIAAIVWPHFEVLTVAGGALLTALGWKAKLTIITEAAATRGLHIPRTPVRGRGTSRAVARSGWEIRDSKGNIRTV